MADSTSDRGFAKMNKKDVSRIGKMGAEAQPIEAKRKGAEALTDAQRAKGGRQSHKGTTS